ncbi:MAG: hypothetical protein JKY95_10085 [Planctomycetaceae bacterium]|nr:hypothetical protein [Planctomycetaceae bacterium]
MNSDNDELFTPEGNQPIDSDYRSNPGSINKQKTGCGLKVFLIVLASMGGLSLLCCCGIGISLYSMVPQIEQNPVIAQQELETILKIELPEGFEPQGTIKMKAFSLISMNGVFISSPEDDGMIMVMGFSGTLATDQGVLDSIRDSIDTGNTEIEVDEIEKGDEQTHERTINGEVVKFQFIKGKTKESQKEVRQIHAVINGAQGPIIFIMSVSEEEWDEEQALKMIDSIELPAN